MENPAKILIIEDDETLSNLYLTRFKLEGFDVEVATDGESGLEKVIQWKPNLLLLDLRIPKINGMDVLARLKARQDTKDIPVIVLTAIADENIKQKCLDLGANDFLTKAYSLPKEILDKINSYLKK